MEIDPNASNASNDSATVFTITFRASKQPCGPGWPPLSRRLAGFLKTALRGFGFKCISIEMENRR